MRRAGLLLLAIALLGAGGCGDDDGANSESAAQLLERGFATDVDTGIVTLDAELEVEGGPGEGVYRLELEGPFRASGPIELGDMDLEFRASGTGREFDGRAIVTETNAWIEFQGQTYEVGEEAWARLREAIQQQQSSRPQTFAEGGVNPLAWVTDAEEAGDEEVNGTSTTQVTGTLDIEKLLRDVNRIASGDGLPEGVLSDLDEAIDDVEFEAWIGDDDIWRRISAETDFEVPEEGQASLGGIEGGNLSIDLRLAEPNQPVEIEGPAEARPIEELLRRLGIPPEVLLGPGFAQPAPG